MKKIGFFVFAIIVIGVILYVTFIIALLKITIGLILLAVAVILFAIAYQKIKHRLED
ncbi:MULTISPECIES: hypothetical protein [Mesonia]|uniref:Uncharacterized protein n=1 Tax=Mesonia oceanica TaxID=2687242 RepID=A0AC61Y4J6_9FLAO|nr:MULTISPECIES: hypothetical protein [Mesonia]VVU98962.1 hypothetical protein FVB9532_00211 [Mesonia oceanica]|tara:strand:- start:3682 stop:3852 length:171 start_codon:yes stop_codon:yes gene_type:complete